MGKTTGAYAVQRYLFDGELDLREVKKPEEPKNIAIFPTVTEFPKEKQARERIRQRREAGALPSTEQTRTGETSPKQEVPDPLPKRVILEQPAAYNGNPLEHPPVTSPGKRPQPTPPPETAQTGMCGTDRIITALICTSGLATAGMSIYDGHHYLLAAGKPSWVAMITAVVMVVFSSTIFAFPFRGRRLFGYALRGLGLATVSFSIFSTIAVNYDQFSEREEAEASIVRTNEAKQAEPEMLREQLVFCPRQMPI